MVELIKKWWYSRKQEMQINHCDNIRSQFQVDERNGELYILCGGIAVKCMSPDSSAQEICDTIDTMRSAALQYDKDEKY